MSSDLGISTANRRDVLNRRIRWFVAATITYNVVEATIALFEGHRVSSTALVGFGLDSVIEVSSAAALAWQFSARDPETREKAALRFIAFSFFALAIYIAVDSITSLAGVGLAAEHSTIGIALATASLVIMPVLSYAQRRAGRELGSTTAVADSKQTLLCTYLSAVLLAGLLLNSLLGWSSDPLAGLVIAAIAVREGINAWRGDTCCPAPAPTDSADCDCCGDQQ
ncbi:hypothetical protein GOEFS_076_00040 [Gordonia effusa NBRC 100432]|uniref:Cation efflux protein transmembrane domain-containing protein n=1 Tax=Gordonia effusa NBRC 100432 TaxID=1077974 RepID=H0R274_9ACTN|nr:cation transporter [Gordonia effusa]GAB19175.1 hypothetical protein GOEFS_076_00040 [Gordonia effusa NBRC 100432]